VFVTARFVRTCAERLAADRNGLLRGPRKLLLLGRERFTGRGRGVRTAWRSGEQEARRRQAVLARGVASGAGRLVAAAREHQERDAVGLARGPGKRLTADRAVLENAERVLRLADPLRRGYARIFSSAGKPVVSAAEAGANESILVRFHDGDLKADVRGVRKKENKP
jgi:exonuclease VII large subunit